MTNEERFLDLVRPHWRRLHVVARQYVHQEPDAQDLVQEGLLRAWRDFSRGGERTYRRGWLFAILRNTAVDWLRSRSRRIRLDLAPETDLSEMAAADPAEPLSPLPGPGEERFLESLDERLVAALDALAEPFREVLILSVGGDLTYREIAEVLDCPVGTVMSRIARARRMLRERLGAAFGTRRLPRERPR